jgi:hypothetical protein
MSDDDRKAIPGPVIGYFAAVAALVILLIV